jgi:phenylalanyl-tRNA synthetase beta chain
VKTDIETFALQVLDAHVSFVAVGEAQFPWEQPAKSAKVLMDGKLVGRITAVPEKCKRSIDEHLAAWSIVVAELNLSAVSERSVQDKKLIPIPVYPRIDVDFSLLSPASRQYAEIEQALARYDHALLRRLAFVDSYEGGSVPAGQRSFTFRATIADASRTLTEADIQSFRSHFIEFVQGQGLSLRS